MTWTQGDEEQIRAVEGRLAQDQQAHNIAMWAAEAAKHSCTAGIAAVAKPRVANLYAAQSSMERMDDLIEAAEGAAKGQPIVVGDE